LLARLQPERCYPAGQGMMAGQQIICASRRNYVWRKPFVEMFQAGQVVQDPFVDPYRTRGQGRPR
jgi:hypothetical protein